MSSLSPLDYARITDESLGPRRAEARRTDHEGRVYEKLGEEVKRLRTKEKFCQAGEVIMAVLATALLVSALALVVGFGVAVMTFCSISAFVAAYISAASLVVMSFLPALSTEGLGELVSKCDTVIRNKIIKCRDTFVYDPKYSRFKSTYDYSKAQENLYCRAAGGLPSHGAFMMTHSNEIERNWALEQYCMEDYLKTRPWIN